MKTYLITHTNPDGRTGVACAAVPARTERSATKKFDKQYPGRKLSVVGVKGQES